MAHVFLVQHVHTLNDDEDDVKLIGIYSTEERAADAVERARKLPGFCDAPDGFNVDGILVDEDRWTDGYVTAR
jgi:hypothetical protein